MTMRLLLLTLSLSSSLAAAPLRFCAVGDILLDRGIRKVIENHDAAFPLAKVKTLIKSHDLAFWA